MPPFPHDPFHPPRGEHAYDYWHGGDMWILRSYGPDEKTDADLEVIGERILSVTSSPFEDEALRRWVYDPTNGITSSGDIIKTGP